LQIAVDEWKEAIDIVIFHYLVFILFDLKSEKTAIINRSLF